MYPDSLRLKIMRTGSCSDSCVTASTADETTLSNVVLSIVGTLVTQRSTVLWRMRSRYGAGSSGARICRVEWREERKGISAYPGCREPSLRERREERRRERSCDPSFLYRASSSDTVCGDSWFSGGANELTRKLQEIIAESHVGQSLKVSWR